MAQQLAWAKAADVVEGNFSCGNMKLENGEYKPIICYDLDAFDSGVRAMCAGACDLPKAVKLTPTTERRFLLGCVRSCLEHGVDYIILANTVPNSYLQKPDGTPAITMVQGGLAGRGLIPIVSGMIMMVAPMLKGTKTKIIAAGGVETGEDAYTYLRLGAHGFVAGTLLWRDNFDPRALQQVLVGGEGTQGLIDLLLERGLPD